MFCSFIALRWCLPVFPTVRLLLFHLQLISILWGALSESVFCAILHQTSHSFIHSCQYGLRTSYFIQWVLVYCYYLLWCSNLASGSLTRLAFVFFWHFPHYSLRPSSLLGRKRTFILILYFLCPSPRISFFFREPWFLLVEKGI